MGRAGARNDTLHMRRLASWKCVDSRGRHEIVSVLGLSKGLTGALNGVMEPRSSWPRSLGRIHHMSVRIQPMGDVSREPHFPSLVRLHHSTGRREQEGRGPDFTLEGTLDEKPASQWHAPRFRDLL